MILINPDDHYETAITVRLIEFRDRAHQSKVA
jgi:hypothetical protein